MAGKGACPHPDCVRATSPSGVLTEHQIEGLRLELRTLAEQNQVLRGEVRMHRQKHDGEYWAWQGDEDDHPESLTCPVLVPADTVRGWIAVQQRAEQFMFEDGKIPPNKPDAVAAMMRLFTDLKPKDHGRGPGGA